MTAVPPIVEVLRVAPFPACREAAETIEELVDALRRIQDEANTVCGDWRETASLIDSICLAALHNIGGDA